MNELAVYHWYIFWFFCLYKHLFCCYVLLNRVENISPVFSFRKMEEKLKKNDGILQLVLKSHIVGFLSFKFFYLYFIPTGNLD